MKAWPVHANSRRLYPTWAPCSSNPTPKLSEAGGLPLSKNKCSGDQKQYAPVLPKPVHSCTHKVVHYIV